MCDAVQLRLTNGVLRTHVRYAGAAQSGQSTNIGMLLDMKPHGMTQSLLQLSDQRGTHPCLSFGVEHCCRRSEAAPAPSPCCPPPGAPSPKPSDGGLKNPTSSSVVAILMCRRP